MPGHNDERRQTPSGVLRVAAGPDESAGSQDQPQHADKSDVAWPAEGLCEDVKAETGGKQIEQSDQYSDTGEVLDSDFQILFHIYFLLV